MSRSAELQARISQTLEQLNWNRSPHSLYEPLEYTLALGGKRIRPLVVLLGAELFGDRAEEAMPAALAVELFHNFTLIHDDIMDEAPLRRGKPTVYQRNGGNAAILSGDALFVEAYRHLEKVPAEHLGAVFQTFSQSALEVCEGQQMDMDFEERSDVTVEEYLKMIEMKTAVLLAGSMKLGAIIGGASAADAEHLYQFGRNIGIAFQLQDDFLDAFGESRKTGKQQGGDIIANKKTFLMINAKKHASGEVKQRLESLLESDDAERKVKGVIEIFRELEVDRMSKAAMEEYFVAGMHNLNEISVPEERKSELKALASQLMHREI